MQEDQVPPAPIQTEPINPNQNISQPVGVPTPISGLGLQPEPKHRKKLWIALAVLVIIGVAAATYWLTKSNPSKPSEVTNNTSSGGISLASNQNPASSKNRSSVNFAVGYVNYDSKKLQPIQTSATTQQKLSQISAPAADSKYSGVGFYQINVDTYEQQLVMYDFAKGTTYLVDQENGKVRNFYDPVILSDHYVAYYLSTENDPVTLRGSVIVVDLRTGDKTTLFEDSAANLPWSSCCAVSPDGLHLAMAIPNDKLVVYTAGDPKTQTLVVTGAKFVPVTHGQDGDSYGNSARAYGYPKIDWADNSNILLATGAPLSYTVDSQGTHIATAKNSLAVLDLSTGKLNPIAGTEQYSIAWFGLSSNNTLAFAAYKTGEDLAGGPAAGTAELYTMTYPGGTPQLVSGLTHEMLGAIVLDQADNRLFLQDSMATPITEVSLATSKVSQTYAASGTLIEGYYSQDVVITGDRDSTLPSTQLNLLNLASGQLFSIY